MEGLGNDVRTNAARAHRGNHADIPERELAVQYDRSQVRNGGCSGKPKSFL